MERLSDNNRFILADIEEVRNNLLPLTFTRPVAMLLVGCMSMIDRWRKLLPSGAGIYVSTQNYLQEKFGSPVSENAVIISAHYVADEALAEAVTTLPRGCELVDQSGNTIAVNPPHDKSVKERITYSGSDLLRLTRLTDLFTLNGEIIKRDIPLIIRDMERIEISRSNRVVGNPDDIFIEKGAVVECASLNTLSGPIFISAGSEVMEGSMLRGPLYIGPSTNINMGSKIYGETTIGPHCKIGGEVNNVVITGYTNKAHDGFLGNAVVGEWCNLGAGCNASNLKNDYTEIKQWNYPARRFVRTGLIHCGLVMGDHSKAGINTMFNTATVIGVGVNIHGSGFPRNFIASFSDGSAAGFTEVPLSKFLTTARKVMARRDIELTQTDIRLFEHLHAITDTYR